MNKIVVIVGHIFLWTYFLFHFLSLDLLDYRLNMLVFFKQLYLFIFGYDGSSLLHGPFLYLRQAGATLHCSVLASSCGARASGHLGFSSCWVWTPVTGPVLWSIVSIAAAHELSCSMACAVFPHQKSNPCLLYWEEDSLPLNHQGSPYV